MSVNSLLHAGYTAVTYCAAVFVEYPAKLVHHRDFIAQYPNNFLIFVYTLWLYRGGDPPNKVPLQFFDCFGGRFGCVGQLVVVSTLLAFILVHQCALCECCIIAFRAKESGMLVDSHGWFDLQFSKQLHLPTTTHQTKPTLV